MAKIKKLIERFLSIPKDLTWDELVKILIYFGYNEQHTGKTGGPRRKFSAEDGHIIGLHKPHPNNIVKLYQVRQVVETLTDRGCFNNE
jgi:hypothetical protein